MNHEHFLACWKSKDRGWLLLQFMYMSAEFVLVYHLLQSLSLLCESFCHLFLYATNADKHQICEELCCLFGRWMEALWLSYMSRDYYVSQDNALEQMWTKSCLKKENDPKKSPTASFPHFFQLKFQMTKAFQSSVRLL